MAAEQPAAPWRSRTYGRYYQASAAVILINNPLGEPFEKVLSHEARIYEAANMQSIGACIENMCLQAQSLGLASLWVCDHFFAYGEIQEALGMKLQIAALLCIGYAAETPARRPKKPLKEQITWLD